MLGQMVLYFHRCDCTYLHLQSPIIVLRFAAFDKRAKAAPDSRDTQSLCKKHTRHSVSTKKSQMQEDRKKGKNQ